jgi:hypothetical protein
MDKRQVHYCVSVWWGGVSRDTNTVLAYRNISADKCNSIYCTELIAACCGHVQVRSVQKTYTTGYSNLKHNIYESKESNKFVLTIVGLAAVRLL